MAKSQPRYAFTNFMNDLRESMRLLKLPLITMAVVAVIGGSWVWWHGRNSTNVSFTTAMVKHGDVVARISETGTIEQLEVVDVGAQVAGRVSAFGLDEDGKAVDYGSTVEHGALLAKIDDSVYAADLAVAKAGELSAMANVEQMNAK